MGMRVRAVSGHSAMAGMKLVQRITAPEAADSTFKVAPIALLKSESTQNKAELSRLTGKGGNVDVWV
jgi:hypothetical protein